MVAFRARKIADAAFPVQQFINAVEYCHTHKVAHRYTSTLPLKPVPYIEVKFNARLSDMTQWNITHTLLSVKLPARRERVRQEHFPTAPNIH